MNKKLKLFVIALCYVPLAFAQTGQTEGQNANETNESAFTFTEAQLGEDDDMSQNVTIVSSNNNIYASEVGYLFSPARFIPRIQPEVQRRLYQWRGCKRPRKRTVPFLSGGRFEPADKEPGVLAPLRE